MEKMILEVNGVNEVSGLTALKLPLELRSSLRRYQRIHTSAFICRAEGDNSERSDNFNNFERSDNFAIIGVTD